MRFSCAILAVSCTALCVEGSVHRLRSQVKLDALSLEATGDWTAYMQAESEDRNFLLAQLDETENELVKLEQSLKVDDSHFAGLQISAAPVEKTTAKKADEKKAVATPVAKKTAVKEEDPAKIMASLGLPPMKLKGNSKAALAPMLAMLKGLYDDTKERISQQNVREEKSKKWFAGKEVEHKAKIATIEGNFHNGTLSEEFHTNETRDETRYFTYWQRCRERQHRQFHTNLKIQHAMMMKVKKMIDMYEKTLSGDTAGAKKQLAAATGMPEIVFLQTMHRNIATFCKESLAEVRKEKVELEELAHERLQ